MGESTVVLSATTYAAVVTALTVVYWLLSGGLTFFNKWFFTIRGFHFPVLVVMGTFVAHSIFTWCGRKISSRYFDGRGHSWYVPKKQVVSREVYLRYLTMIGLCTGLEIASSNLALLRLSVSFHTMVHASKPVFIAGWSVFIGLERADWKLATIVGLVALGVILLSLGESSINPIAVPLRTFDDNSTLVASNVSSTTTVTAMSTSLMGDEERLEDASLQPLGKSPHADPGFDPVGFGLIMFSCFCSGGRWSLVQLMLQKVEVEHGQANGPPERLTPLNLIYFVAPIGAVALFPFFLGLEAARFAEYLRIDVAATADLVGFEVLLSVWSLCLTLVEFYFVRFTSGLVLSFAAISKELLLVTISVLVNGDSLPVLNVVGFFLCVVGIVSYHRRIHSAEQSYESIEQSAGVSDRTGSGERSYMNEDNKSMEAIPIKAAGGSMMTMTTMTTMDDHKSLKEDMVM